MNQALIETIKTRGYYRVNFCPLEYEKYFNTQQECEQAVLKNKVRLRGWDYPHFPSSRNQSSGLVNEAEYVEGWTDARHHKEFWRMYKSSQFLHYKALIEDWTKEYGIPTEPVEPGTRIGINGSIVYAVSEILEFLQRLVGAGLYSSGVNLNISIHGLQNRFLYVDDPNRMPVFDNYQCHSDEFIEERFVSPQDAMFKSDEIAMEIIVSIMHLFNWENPPVDALLKHRSEFLAGAV